MHRHRLRAFVTTIGETDVPVTIFADKQYLRFIKGVGILSTSLGPGSSTINNVATWGDTTGTQLLQVPVAIDNAGNVTGVTTINGTDPGDWVRGPADSVESTLATWNGTTGRLLRNTSTITSVGGQIREVDEINSIGVTEHGLGVGPAKLLSSINSMTLGDTTISNVTALDGVDPLTWVVGPGSATDSHVALFNGATGKILKQSVVVIDSTGNITGVATINGTDPALWMKGAASSVAARLVTYADATGKQASNAATVTASGGSLGSVSALNSITVGTTTLANVSTLDGVDPLTWVVGPNSATTNRLATFNGTTGKLIQDGTIITASGGAISGVSTLDGVNPLTWVVGPTSASDRFVTIFNGTTGKLITDANVSIDTSGNITGGLYNGVNVAGHNARHLPDGADSLTNTSSWQTGDSLTYNGSGTLYRPKWSAVQNMSSASIGGSFTSPTGANIQLPARSGPYHVWWVFAVALGDSAASFDVNVSWTVGSGNWVFLANGSGGFSSSGTAITGSTGGLTSVVAFHVSVLLTSATSGFVSLQLRSGGASLSVVGGGAARAIES
jgi:hypothetical protein